MKSNSSKRLAGGEPGGLDPALAAVAVAGGDLGAEQHLGEALIAPLTPRGPGRRAPAAPWRRRALSARGTGARARTRSWSCRDQRVIAGQRPDLDLDLVPLAAPLALALKLGLMRRVGDRQAAGEHAAVPARELAGVQHDRGDLRSARREPRRDGRRTAGRSSSRCDRPARTAAPGPGAPGGGRGRASWRAAAASASAPPRAARPGPPGSCGAPAGSPSRSHQPSRLILEVEVVREHGGPARSSSA